MDMITEIRRERGIYRVVVNDAEIFCVPGPLFRERPLHQGEPLDIEEYDNWLMVRQYRYALDRSVAYLASRARSRREIEQKLLQCGYRPCTVEMVLYKLEKEKLLNDADFAQQWVAARATRKLGRERIERELRQKGVPAEEAEEALKSLTEEDQLSAAVALAQKAASRAKPGEDRRKLIQRITGMLIRRGFSWDIAHEAITQMLDNASIDE